VTEDLGGQAAFFYMVTGFLQPPVDPVGMSLLISVITVVPLFVRSVYNLLFVCAAWAISVIAGAISHRIRGFPSQQDAFLQLQSSGYDCGGLPQAACLQLAIFQGFFLETGPVVVHAVFFALGAAVMLWIKLKHKQYVFSTVFGTICLVITMSYGPLFPYFYGTLGVLSP
jgi:hypothetical protein